jgi:F-type H+-transporting ATPase subunit O
MISTRVFYRGLATAKSVKPPVQLFGIDGTYATALYSASVQDSSVAQSFQELSKVDNLLKTDAKVKNFLLDPSLTKQDKTSVIEVVAQKLSLDKTTANFLKVLSENNRLDHLSGIYEKFGQLNDASQGVVEAKITSAKPLDSKILKRLQSSIAKSSFVGEGKTLKLSNDVNPDILGGLIVEVGDRTVDLSIQSKVSKINQSLAEAL